MEATAWLGFLELSKVGGAADTAGANGVRFITASPCGNRAVVQERKRAWFRQMGQHREA
jgi:hypothetical protein